MESFKRFPYAHPVCTPNSPCYIPSLLYFSIRTSLSDIYISSLRDILAALFFQCSRIFSSALCSQTLIINVPLLIQETSLFFEHSRIIYICTKAYSKKLSKYPVMSLTYQIIQENKEKLLWKIPFSGLSLCLFLLVSFFFGWPIIPSCRRKLYVHPKRH
jgi:hypothetical protein